MRSFRSLWWYLVWSWNTNNLQPIGQIVAIKGPSNVKPERGRGGGVRGDLDYLIDLSVRILGLRMDISNCFDLIWPQVEHLKRIPLQNQMSRIFPVSLFPLRLNAERCISIKQLCLVCVGFYSCVWCESRQVRRNRYCVSSAHFITQGSGKWSGGGQSYQVWIWSFSIFGLLTAVENKTWSPKQYHYPRKRDMPMLGITDLLGS